MVRDMTETNLRSAFAGESQAHMRYKIFAERAQKLGWPNVARLFDAVAYAERIHAGNHFRNILTKGGTTTVSGSVFGSTDTSDDLQAGMDGESFEITEMYPAYIATAHFQGEKPAETGFSWALEAEKLHLDLYKRAKVSVDQKKDVALGPLQVCSTCGYTVEGDAPDRCPVCNSPKEKFRSF